MSWVPVNRHQIVGLEVLQVVTAFVLQLLELWRQHARARVRKLLAGPREPGPESGSDITLGSTANFLM